MAIGRTCIALILLLAIAMASYIMYLKSTIEGGEAREHDKYIRYSISASLRIVRDLDEEIIRELMIIREKNISMQELATIYKDNYTILLDRIRCAEDIVNSMRYSAHALYSLDERYEGLYTFLEKLWGLHADLYETLVSAPRKDKRIQYKFEAYLSYLEIWSAANNRYNDLSETLIREQEPSNKLHSQITVVDNLITTYLNKVQEYIALKIGITPTPTITTITHIP